jgi:hypothetical protein
VVNTEDAVFVERKIEKQPAPVPVFRNVRDAEIAPRPRIHPE